MPTNMSKSDKTPLSNLVRHIIAYFEARWNENAPIQPESCIQSIPGENALHCSGALRLANNRPEKNERRETPFDVRIPMNKLAMNFNTYVRRLCSAFDPLDRDVTCGVALEYIDRLRSRLGGLDERSSHKILAVSLLLAHKYLSDTPYYNQDWAAAVGLKLPELNAMEVAALDLMYWSVYVDPDCFNMTQRAFKAACSEYPGHKVTFDCGVYDVEKWNFGGNFASESAGSDFNTDTETDQSGYSGTGAGEPQRVDDMTADLAPVKPKLCPKICRSNISDGLDLGQLVFNLRARSVSCPMLGMGGMGLPHAAAL